MDGLGGEGVSLNGIGKLSCSTFIRDVDAEHRNWVSDQVRRQIRQETFKFAVVAIIITATIVTILSH